MKLKVTSQKRNELLKRDEVAFTANHEGSGTPSRTEVKQKLTSMLGADEERVCLRRFETKTGSTTAVGEASVYDSVEQAKYVEPEYIILRNAPKSEKKE